MNNTKNDGNNKSKEVTLEEFAKEIGYGEIRVTVVNERLFQIPRQVIRRPKKYGTRTEIYIDEPIRLKKS